MGEGWGGGASDQDSAALLWKISCPPTAGAGIVTVIRQHRPDAQALYDWSGGLVWLALDSGDASADDAAHVPVRAALRDCGGHATLIRAPEAVRARIPVFQPQTAALTALSHRVKESFDPKHIFTAGRLG